MSDHGNPRRKPLPPHPLTIPSRSQDRLIYEVPPAAPVREKKQYTANVRPVDSSDAVQKAPSRYWPSSPRPLSEKSFFTYLYIVGDVLIALVPIAFIVLCILSARLHDTPTQNNTLGQRVTQATQLGPTLFPIVFAAIAGRTLKLIARFAASRPEGAKLGTLEMLVASQTVWGAFESQVLLRRLTVVGAHVLLLWALSPLGGQASLRLLETAPRYRYSETPVRGMDKSGLANTIGVFMTSTQASNVSAINAMFVTSLLAPEKVRDGPMDTWGNVKIPRLTLEESEDENGWAKVDMAQADGFSSLIGLPVAGLPPEPVSFVTTDSYLDLACSRWLRVPLNDPWWTTQLGYVYGNAMPSGSDSTVSSPFNVTPPAMSSWIPTSFFLDTNTVITNEARNRAALGYNLTTEQAQDPTLGLVRNVLFGSRTPNDPRSMLALTNCSVSQVHVDALVNCTTHRGCSAMSIRKSKFLTTPENLTPLDSIQVAYNMFRNFQVATGANFVAGTSSPIEAYLMNSSVSPFSPGALPGYDWLDLSMTDPAVFARRLSTLLNSYYSLSLAPFAFTGLLPSNLSRYGPANVTQEIQYLPRQDRLALTEAPMITRESRATVTHETQIYRCNFLWLALLAACSSIVLLLGLSGLLLRVANKAPDMLGFVSSMTYDNPHVQLPQGSGPLDGMERARALRDLRMRIADVNGLDAVGHVAVVSVDDQDGMRGRAQLLRPLERHRTYF